MNKEEQNINATIAKACGWTQKRQYYTYPTGEKTWHLGWISPTGGRYINPPSYTRDLNRCHDMEGVLSFDQYHITFIGLLQSATERQWIEANGDNIKNRGQQSACFATAKQRCDAFLKVVGG